MKNITLKELANQLDLSVSTVSRALTDSYEINIKTKKRVKRIICFMFRLFGHF